MSPKLLDAMSEPHSLSKPRFVFLNKCYYAHKYLTVFIIQYCSSDLEKDLDLSDSDDGSVNEPVPRPTQLVNELAPVPSMVSAEVDRKREAAEA